MRCYPSLLRTDARVMKSILIATLASSVVAQSELYKLLADVWRQGRAAAPVDAHPPQVFGHALAAAQAHVRANAESWKRALLASHASAQHTQTYMHGSGFMPRFTQPSVADPSHSYYPDTPAGFYGVLPEYLTSVVPGGAAVSWSSGCLTSNQATASMDADGSGVNITVTASAPNASAPGCVDFYLFGTVDDLNVLSISSPGTFTLRLAVRRAPWTSTFGVRTFRFIHDPITTIGDALSTISLFVPSLTEATLDAGSMAVNLQFLRDYVGIDWANRTAGTIDMDWDYVQSGDLFVVDRLDGLGTMEQWGTGARSTHIVSAMRFGPDNHLYIVESTAKDAYWPLDNIQMNAIETWLPMAEASMYSIVHLPLSDAVRATFNVTAAQNYILDNIGYPYGYHNFVNTFFDNADFNGLDGNLPWPASWEFVEVVANFLESVDRNLTDQLFADATNMRLQTQGLDLATCALKASSMGMTFGQLIAVPEEDDWVYSDGPSQVCDVFYCSIMKAGGVFGPLADSIKCREFHNADVYQMTWYNLTATRPAACVAADPDLPYCQIMGPIKLVLDNVNTRSPYAHMSETCSQLPLGYTRQPAKC